MRKLSACAPTVNQSKSMAYLPVTWAMTWFQNGLAKRRIIETTKQYMAVDSIIARPTNRVRVMVAEASGCWASEFSAVATARPSPSAGAMVPKPVVMPAMTMDATAMMVMLSIIVAPLVVIVAVSWAWHCL